MPTQHAKLSASGSAKWLNCPGSVKAEEVYPRGSSAYADEGTLAHDLADLCLKRGYDADHFVGKTLKSLKIKNGTYGPEHRIEKDMARYVQEYLDYVLSFETANSMLRAEERVDFSNFIPDGFGTSDAAVIDPDERICHIFDLKYGKGVPVDAFENTQAQMYAIGFLNEFGWLDEFDSFRLHIIQPRIPNNSSWDISVTDLLKFAEWAKERAELALSPNAPRVPGEKQCRWCAAQGDCKALAKFTEDIIGNEFDEMDSADSDSLSDAQKKVILDNKDLIVTFLNSIDTSVYNRLYEGGEFKGYKLVEGRSNRVWGDDAEKVLTEKLGDEAFNKKLIGITDAQKKVGKDVVNELAYKPPGKLTLVPESDKRKAVNPKENVEDEFEE